MPSDPRLIKAGLDSTESVILDLVRGAEEAITKIEDPNVRRALVSLSSAVNLLRALTIIALEPYRRELEERIDHQI